jgi:DNA transformation protein and related proteins
MTASDNFATYAVELPGAAGRVAARMFAGHSLYCDGVMLALIADDGPYLNADSVNRRELERVGSAPFTCEAKGRRTSIACWRAS